MFDQIKKLLKHTVIYGSAETAMQAVRFFLIPLYTRYLTPGDYGVLELIVITSLFFEIISKMGVDQGFFKFYFAESTDEGKKRVVSTMMIFLAIVSLCLTCGLFVFARSMSLLIIGRSGNFVLFRVMSIALFFLILSLIPFQFLRANEKSLQYSILSFSRSVLMTVLGVFFVVVLRKGVAGILLGQFIGRAIVFFFLLAVVYKVVKPVFSFKILRGAMAFGLPIVISALLEWLWRTADRFLLKRFSSLKDVGLYSLGMRFSLPVAMMVSAFQIAWFPFIFSIADKKDEKKIHSRTLTYFLFVASFLWLIISVVAKEVIGLMTAPAFHNAYKVVPLVAGMQVLFGAYYVVRAGILLAGKTMYLSFIFAIAASASIGLNCILIPRYGISGAGVTALISSFLIYSVTHIISHRLYPVLYESRRVSKIVLIAFALYVISTLVRGAYLTVLPLKLLIIFSYPLLLGIIGFY